MSSPRWIMLVSRPALCYTFSGKEVSVLAFMPPIDPRILEESEKMNKAKKRQARRQWLFDNLFNILDLIIAFVALIVAIFGLYLPKG